MTATRQFPQQVSAAARIAGAIAALAVIAAGVAFASDASERAVNIAQASMNPAVRYVVLQKVEIVATRLAADSMDTACAVPAAKQI
jgi:hypothetical protein